MGDPIPNYPVPRRRRKQLLAAIPLLLALALSGMNSAVIFGAVGRQYQFAGSQGLNVVATYQFGTGPGSQSLSAGSQGTFTLRVTYFGTTPTSLVLQFNVTSGNAGAFVSGCRPQTNCVGPSGGDISISIDGSPVFGPVNSGLPVDYYNSATVPVVTGENVYSGLIDVAPTAQEMQSFVLQWTATQ